MTYAGLQASVTLSAEAGAVQSYIIRQRQQPISCMTVYAEYYSL